MVPSAMRSAPTIDLPTSSVEHVQHVEVVEIDTAAPRSRHRRRSRQTKMPSTSKTIFSRGSRSSYDQSTVARRCDAVRRRCDDRR